LIPITWTEINEKGWWSNPAAEALLEGSDAIIFGCPTYMGSTAAAFKIFMEWAFNPWRDQRWKDKVAAGFTNSVTQSGDKLNTLVDLAVFAAQMGMIWVGSGDPPGNNWSGGSRNDINRLGAWLGAMGQSNADAASDVEPPESDRTTAQRLGRRVTLIAGRLTEGREYVTERIKAF
jgi:multimeric flavodoxin WrbA